MRGSVLLVCAAMLLCHVTASTTTQKSSSTKAPTTSTTMKTTTQNTTVSTTARPIGNLYMHQAHGLFMLTAWMVFFSFAIMVSRYYRVAWPKKKLFGKQVWFQLHTFFNVVGLVLLGIGIVVIFSAVRGISGFKSFRPLFTKIHPYIGMVVTGLVIFNGLIPLCRGAQRTVFNWVHWAVGIITYVAGIVTCFSGLNMSSFCPDWTIWVMLGWVGFHVGICIVLEIQKCSGKQIEKGFPSVYGPIPDGGGIGEKGDKAGASEKDTLLHGSAKPGDRGNTLRYWLLALWIIVTLAIFGVLFWGTLTGSWTGI